MWTFAVTVLDTAILSNTSVNDKVLIEILKKKLKKISGDRINL